MIGRGKPQILQTYSWPLAVFVVSRAGLFVLAYLSLIFLPLNADIGIRHALPNNFDLCN